MRAYNWTMLDNEGKHNLSAPVRCRLWVIGGWWESLNCAECKADLAFKKQPFFQPVVSPPID